MITEGVNKDISTKMANIFVRMLITFSLGNVLSQAYTGSCILAEKCS